MATEANNSGDQNANGNEGRVTFTPEQQERIDQIIRERMGKAGREAREEAEAARAELRTTQERLAALEVASKAKTNTPEKGKGNEAIEALQAQIAEMKTAGESTKAETERLRQLVQAKEVEAKEARDSAMNTRKAIAMRDAASKSNFVEVGDVVQLTQNSVKWDDTRQRFVVLNDAGTERLNDAYEPMSLDEFYTEFASKRPSYVRGDVKSGAGSTESQRTGLASNGKYAVEQVFGPKSSALLASRLMKENPSEYRRLRGVAKDNGLLA